MKRRLYFLATVLLGMSFSIQAQSSDNFLNGMIERINGYYLDMTHDNLYLHTDRSVYFPGDEIFIEAYVMDAATLMPTQRSNQYNLMLVNDKGSMVYSSVYNIFNGRSSGKFQLPENLNQGTYKLLGFSMNNNVNSANKVFNKTIFLADPTQGMMLDYDLNQVSYKEGDQVELVINSFGVLGKPQKNILINYSIENQETTIMDGGIKSDKEGATIINFEVPLKPENVHVELLAEKRKASQPLSIGIPVMRAVDHIDLQPEGGALIAGSAGKVGFRAYDDAGKPVDFTGSLYGGTEKIADLQTFGSGIGVIDFVPESGKNYEIRTGVRSFKLPAVTESGAALRIIGQSGGKLQAAIVRSGEDFPGSTQVLVAILRKGLLYWSAPGTLDQTAKMDIPVKRIPPGVSTLAVFSKDGKLLSSRTFYLKEQSKPELEISLNRAQYKSRQKVTVDLSVMGSVPSNADNITLSMSVVPKDLLLDQGLLIDDYMMIESDVLEDSQDLLKKYAITGDDALLDALLLSSTWNGYSWEHVLGEEGKVEMIEELSSETMPPADNILSYPDELNAAPLLDFSIGITDKRHPGVGEPMYKRQLENGMSVLEVIKTIKPFTMSGGKILFQGVNSFYNQQGALIIIDGQQAGDNADILSSITPTEVESINVSTNPGEIQKYTGLNVVGVIEINLRGSGVGSRMKKVTPRDEEVRKAMGDYMDGYPDYAIENDSRSVMNDNRTLLYWDSELELNESNSCQIEFYTSDIKGTYVVTIQGMVGLNPVAKRVAYEVE